MASDPLHAELERLRAENVKLQAVEESHDIALRTVSTLLDWGGVAGEDLGQRVARIIVERDELRTRLGEYERALTVATVVQAPGPYELRELQGKRCISHLNDSCFLPPNGTQLIARPTHKEDCL